MTQISEHHLQTYYHNCYVDYIWVVENVLLIDSIYYIGEEPPLLHQLFN